MKVNSKVIMKVTIESLVEIYFGNYFHFFEKYFPWGNIHSSRDFLDTLYTLYVPCNEFYPTWIFFLFFILIIKAIKLDTADIGSLGEA